MFVLSATISWRVGGPSTVRGVLPSERRGLAVTRRSASRARFDRHGRVSAGPRPCMTARRDPTQEAQAYVGSRVLQVTQPTFISTRRDLRRAHGVASANTWRRSHAALSSTRAERQFGARNASRSAGSVSTPQRSRGCAVVDAREYAIHVDGTTLAVRDEPGAGWALLRWARRERGCLLRARCPTRSFGPVG